MEIENLKKQRGLFRNYHRAGVQKQKLELESRQENVSRELRLQIETLKDDLRKVSERADQGSIQAQGEAAELVIEENFKLFFQRTKSLK